MLIDVSRTNALRRGKTRSVTDRMDKMIKADRGSWIGIHLGKSSYESACEKKLMQIKMFGMVEK